MHRFCQSSFLRAKTLALDNRGKTPGSSMTSILSFNRNQKMFSASLHTKSKSIRDKYGRRVTRRIIRIADSSHKSKKKSSKKWPKLQKIPAPQNMVPKKFTDPPPNLKPLIPIGPAAPKATQKKARRKLKQWLKDNAGIIILNCGSICSFLSFTRMDILELRMLSVTGSLSSIIYFSTRPPPLVIAPIIWSSVFTGTNLYMMYLIYEERKGKPKPMTPEEESTYEEHFLPHAVTPRQYEKLLKIAKKRDLKRGDVLIQKGEKMNSVFLVVSGATEAVNTMSRRVTAASSTKGNKENLAGGDAGAWIGEIAFFDYLSERDRQVQTFKPPPPPGTGAGAADMPLATAAAAAAAEKNALKEKNMITRETATQNAILTYIATQDDTLVFEWDFEELADLMRTSSDLRSSVSRAMTAAVVGKVVNLYISRTDAKTPMWEKWIGKNWRQPAADVPVSAVRVKVVGE